jgi:hypothetical protein
MSEEKKDDDQVYENLSLLIAEACIFIKPLFQVRKSKQHTPLDQKSVADFVSHFSKEVEALGFSLDKMPL